MNLENRQNENGRARAVILPLMVFAILWALYSYAFQEVKFATGIAPDHWLSSIHTRAPLILWIAIKYGLLIVSAFALWRGLIWKELSIELLIATSVLPIELIVEYPLRANLPAAIDQYFSLELSLPVYAFFFLIGLFMRTLYTWSN